MAVIPCKVTDLIKTDNKKSYSIEVTPSVCEEQLLSKFKVEPLFYSITWHAGQHKCRSLDIPPLKLAKFLKKHNKNVILHLSCNFLRKNFVDDLLVLLQKEGICNLFVILGENYNPNESDFASTQELIRYIRKKTGDYFCIGVAAYPDEEDKLRPLLDKIKCGANFIITQAFFDIEKFGHFLKKCTSLGITTPILPGILPFEHENELTGFINMCKVRVSEQLLEDVKTKTGYEIVSKQINDLYTILKFNHFHLFTLDNLQRVENFNEIWSAVK